MNGIVQYFLPSLIRGVYRFDERLSKNKTAEDAYTFIVTKLHFLPQQFIDIIKNKINFEELNYASSISRKLLACKSPQFNVENKNRFQRYFHSHRYFKNQIEQTENEQNYLEAQFIRRVLSPILSWDGLQKVRPQHRIGNYVVDFTMNASRNYVFEIDGFGKFENRRALDRFLARQNELVLQGWAVFRYSYTDIMENTECTRRKVFNILFSDEKIRPFLLDSARRIDRLESQLFPTDGKLSNIDPIDLVNDFYSIQDYCVSILIDQTTNPCEIDYFIDCLPYPIPLVAFALSDLYNILSSVENLLGLDFNLVPLRIINRTFDSEYFQLLHPLINAQLQETNIPSIQDEERSITTDVLLSFSSLVNQPPPHSSSFNYLSDLNVETIHDYLGYISSSIFRFETGTKPHQEKVLKSIFDGRDILGIYPTGSGKSFCFWLAALLKPGLSIVICPLRSLMRDQRLTLDNYGITSVDFINSDVKKADRLRIINDAIMGKLKLLYVAPERLRIKEFIEDINRIIQFVNINYLIIDEAHCISEWGHDFRPSYMKIPWFYRQLKQVNDSLQLISLTATAGQMVQMDIMNLLNLRKEDILKETDLDRINFSYQIETINNSRLKDEVFNEILTKSIPKSLSHYLSLNPNESGIYEVVNSINKKNEKGIGIIYVVYADPHGKNTAGEGLAHYLYATKKILEPNTMDSNPSHWQRRIKGDRWYSLESFGTGKVRGFSSTPPTLCPVCYSYNFINKKNNVDNFEIIEGDDIDIPVHTEERKLCLNCGHEFLGIEAKSPENYDKMTQQNQIDFKRGTIDILVATKGFGMGIDKPSVRFIVHTTPSSSIESWYQEIGRAGRDGERAHCASMADIPNDACFKELENMRKKIPPCNWFTECRHGKERICDYGKQHLFIKNSYPGVAADVISAIRTLDRIITSYNESCGAAIQLNTQYAQVNSHELALYRLTIIGIVEDFSLIYMGRIVQINVIVKYQGNQNKTRDLFIDPREIKKRLKAYLDNNNLFHENVGIIDDRIRECKEKYSNDIAEKLIHINLKNIQRCRQFYDEIIEYLLVIIDHTYENIVRMRYDMLWNLFKDVITNTTDCRRKPILDYLSEKSEINYRCDLCDNCIKDLNFIRDSRNAPSRTVKMDELDLALKNAFASKTFDYDQLVRLKEAFREYPMATYRKARAILEGSPQNLGALYFAREYSPINEEEANTLRLLEVANRVLDINTVQLLYTSSRTLYKEKLLLLLNDEYGKFNNDEGILWLYLQCKIEYKENEEILEMGETLGLVIICNLLNAKYSKRLQAIINKIEEAYYGRNH